MRFAIGYQLPETDEESVVDLVRDYREHVAEVYFPWLDAASGRSPLATRGGCTDWTAQARLEADLVALREMGVGLDLLFNAACYGGRATSSHLENAVGSTLAHLDELVGGVDTVTTTSPLIAHVVRSHFSHVEVRASVNMRLGTVEAMRQVDDLFDGYYVQRDFNRDLSRLRELKTWADRAGKRLYLLANSGCLRFCAHQTFHDNLVAHEAEVAETAKAQTEGFMPFACWKRMRQRDHWAELLQATWVRPEDLHHYAELFDVVKLATRMHANPRLVLDAYAAGRHAGNLLDLFEPGLGPALAPHVIDNTRFPADWFERTTACDKACHRCGYCEQVLERVLVDAEPVAGATVAPGDIPLHVVN